MVSAVVCRTLGTPDLLKLENSPVMHVGPGEVRIAIHAAGLNFPDILMVAGKYQLKPPMPFIPGMEAAGIVTEVGSGVVHRRPGERVMFRAWHGCYAEETIAPVEEVLPLPENFSFAEGASFMVAVSTATNALLQRGQLQSGEVLLVHGAAGGVGLAAVEVGKLLGATVIATASSPEKLAIARERGSDYAIDYTRDSFKDRVMEITGGNGADLILDTVGGEVFEQSMRCIAWGGRLLVVGFASGRIPEIKMNQPLLKCFSIVGVRAIEHVKRKPKEGAAYRDWMLGWANKDRLRPHVSHVFPLERFREAMKLLESRKAIGRVVIEVRPT
ncbi:MULTISPECIES: NADPH:quinone oxidoreductase family protein [unclassified Polaromonas]|uniref:NADPH:quinone oxidoreductase family protein n=1 Tax=unclassified Polaromonas TaxID=2638319 RepID=UPI000BBBD697|nr:MULTISPECIES: NADPH:quinone oxidoreductase family protein [unclassified Polaromonas]MDI1274773.1 NADPH:quinone oxidoreductase family protein [Polaromonas sp.]